MSGAGPKLLANKRRGMPRYQQSIVFQRCTIINRRLRSRFARVNGVLLFLSAFNSAILTPKPSKSGGCQKKCLLTRTLNLQRGPKAPLKKCRIRYTRLRRIPAARPPFSVVFTLWVSITAALGLGSRPSRSRSITTR